MIKFIIGVVLFFFISASAQKNLIQNGGFETELNNWRGDAATLNPYDKKLGKSSCMINQFVGAEWKGIDQIVTFPKNTVAIAFSAWIKSETIEQGKNPWNTGKFDVEFLNPGDKNNSNESVAAIVGTTSWTLYKKIIPIPANATKFRVMLALGQTNGTIIFDEIKAIALTQFEYNSSIENENAQRIASAITSTAAQKQVFLNGDFENQKNNWNGNFELSNTQKKEGNASCLITSSEFVWSGIDQIASVPENATSITISGWLKAENIAQGKETWNNGLLNVAFTNNENNKTGDDQNVAFVTGTNDWTFYSKTFEIPKETKKYRIMVALSFATGTLYADSINVEFK